MKVITIVGRGLDPEKHLSLQALRTLKQADIILGIEPETESWAKLQQEFGFSNIIDVGFLYKNGAKDLDNYQSFINHIFSTLHNNNNVVLLVAGHPRVGVTFAQLLDKNKGHHDCEIRFVEGISSFDVMLNDLSLDPLERGTSILDANRLLLFQYEIETSLNYFIYHVCSVGTERVHFKDATKENHLSLLQAYLEKYFDKKKIIYLCKASNGKNHQPEYIPVILEELANRLQQVDFGTTLFIPAEKPSQLNFNFFQFLKGAV